MEQPDDAALAAARAVVAEAVPDHSPQAVNAYRVLAVVEPETYLPKAAKGLLAMSGQTDDPEISLRLSAEAAEAARQIAADHPSQPDLPQEVLNGHQRNLQRLGRRPEALAVLQEMHQLTRAAFASGRFPDLADGSRAWACALAEDGRHDEAAEVLDRIVTSTRHLGHRRGGAAWSMMTWASELEAAGRLPEAAEAHAVLAAMEQEALEAHKTSLRCTFYALVAQSQMLGRAGEAKRRAAVLAEAQPLLAELAEAGERKSWSGYQDSYLARLIALSGRPDELPGAEGEVETPIGFGVWSSGHGLWLRFEPGAAALEDALKEAFAELPDRDAHVDAAHLVDLLSLHRRIVTRRAGHLLDRRQPEVARFVFGRGVDLARRLHAADAHLGTEPLIRSLLDRAQAFAAHQSYSEALDDFTAAAALVTNPASPVSAAASA